jgi:plastocyanin
LPAHRSIALTLLAGFLLAPAPSRADEPRFELTIRNHKFEPRELTVPAGQRVVIVVHNEDPTPEEFESESLKVEKVVTGGRQVIVRVGPLGPGRYEFIGEFHKDTAQGALTAVPQ